MKDLWRALSLMAENSDGILDKVRAVAFQEVSDLKPEVEIAEQPGDARRLFMKPQPTTDALIAIYKLFKPYGLFLSAYELAEINRWVAEDRDNHKGRSMQAVQEYWRHIAASNLIKSNKDLQEAAGAMAIDNRLRRNFGEGSVDLRDFGFNLDGPTQDSLREIVAPQQPADAAAETFFRFSWPGSTCGGIIQPYPDWFHMNL